MDRREELKAKAREYERKEQPEHALEVYLGIVGEIAPGEQGGVWARIGDLQTRIGAVANAVESFSRAATAFAENGQPNNAVAVSHRILRLDALAADHHLRLAEIAISQGYRNFAREGIAEYARLTAATDRPEAAVEPLTAFLARFPEEAGICKDWEEELAATGKEAAIPALLDRLHEGLEAGGHKEAADRISRNLVRKGSTNGAGSTDTGAPQVSSDEAPSGGALPLLDNSVAGEQEVEPLAIAPLEGLEPTGGEAYSSDEDDSVAEDLPLLGTLPELTSDRADASGVEPAAPLPGLERFDTGNDSPWRDQDAGFGASSDVGLSSEDDDDGDDYGAEIPYLTPGLPSPRVAPDESAGAASAFHPARIAAELRDHAGVNIEFTDVASHYDLGLAYKEMDRFDESLANLAMAMDGGHDPTAILEVAAEILVRKGEFELADDLLRRLPGVGDHATPEHLGVHYWLARASEEAGRRDDARHALELVVSVDPGFRDASERLRKLV